MVDQLPQYPGMPRWVVISVILAGLIILLVVILVILGDGQHGPLRHLKSAGLTNLAMIGSSGHAPLEDGQL